MTKRTISLPDSMIRYIEDTHLCVSKFLQEKLADKITQEGKAEQYLDKNTKYAISFDTRFKQELKK